MFGNTNGIQPLDSEPTAGSYNAVMSDGIKTALDGKQNTISAQTVSVSKVDFTSGALFCAKYGNIVVITCNGIVPNHGGQSVICNVPYTPLVNMFGSALNTPTLGARSSYIQNGKWQVEIQGGDTAINAFVVYITNE